MRCVLSWSSRQLWPIREWQAQCVAAYPRYLKGCASVWFVMMLPRVSPMLSDVIKGNKIINRMLIFCLK